jgi:phosphoglycolate phosphatase-like HAD superfamily hydrolase
MTTERWATFDCYGTLVDWNAGIGGELGRLFGDEEAPRLLERYHAIEPRVQAERPGATYRDVMATVLAEIAAEIGTELPASERDALGRSLPGWPVFAEVPGALAEAHGRRWKLVALSNTDRDFIDASLTAIGVPFEGAIVAPRSAPTSQPTATGRPSTRRTPTRTGATSTSRRATRTTSSRRPSSGCRRSGSTASASAGSPRRRASCPISTAWPTCSTSWCPPPN